MNSLRKIVRHLRARFRYTMQTARCRPHVRPTDVFLTTYPKSGQTWLAFLIANVLEPNAGTVLNLRTFDNYVPSIQDVYFGSGSFARFAARPDPRIFRGHAPYTPWFPKVVYLVRDPRDVLVSYWHHHKLLKPGFQPSLAEFIARDGDWWPGCWDAHVRGWLEHRHPHIKLVRYEDLKADPATVLRAVLDFANIPYDSTAIDRAVTVGTFEHMRSLEESFGLANVHDHPTERFIRRGQVGGWRDELDPATLQILERKYRPVMEQLGYLSTPVNTPLRAAGG